MLTEFKQKYEQLLVELKAKNPQANIFLVKEPPVKDIPDNNQYFPYRGVALNLAQKYQVPVIDEWTTFINDPSPLSGLLANNVDPNDKGYRVFADAVLKSFADYLMPSYWPFRCIKERAYCYEQSALSFYNFFHISLTKLNLSTVVSFMEQVLK